MNSIKRIIAIAGNTFKEAIRNRAFIALMVATLTLILSSLLLAALAVVGPEKRIIQDFGLFFISLMGVIISVTTGVILVHKELERKTIYTVLARPLHRWEFIIGKYAGMLLILLAEVLFLALTWFLVLYVEGVELEPILAKAVLLIFGELMIVSATALLFSSFSTPVLSGILTLAVFVTGRVVYLVEEILHAKKGIFVTAPALKPFGRALANFFPDLSIFNISKEILLGKEVDFAYIGQAFLYAWSYVLILIVVAVLFFRRRDFI